MSCSLKEKFKVAVCFALKLSLGGAIVPFLII